MGPTDLNVFNFIPDPTDRKFAARSSATGAVLVTHDRHLPDAPAPRDLVVLTLAEFGERVC